MSDSSNIGAPPTWAINEDGSMDRVAPVTDAYCEFAEKRGIELAPDHVPADETDWYSETKGKPERAGLEPVSQKPRPDKTEDKRRSKRHLVVKDGSGRVLYKQ